MEVLAVLIATGCFVILAYYTFGDFIIALMYDPSDTVPKEEDLK